MYNPSDKNFSLIGQLDGNISVSDISQTQPNKKVKAKCDKIITALDLPVVASYNCRSLFPKLDSFKTDIIERQIDCSFISEVCEQSENKQHSAEIEKMLQMDGLKYISTSKPSNKRGRHSGQS